MERAAEYYGFQIGRSGFIKCPFHSGDHTASLKIYPGSRGFHCFGCGAHGTVIDFVMKLFDLTFQQAVIRISSDFNLGLTAQKKTKIESSRILEERRKQQEEKQALDRKYIEMAKEHCYWWEAAKLFAPDELDEKTGYLHPIYAEAVKRLPFLSWWLDEHLARG